MYQNMLCICRPAHLLYRQWLQTHPTQLLQASSACFISPTLLAEGRHRSWSKLAPYGQRAVSPLDAFLCAFQCILSPQLWDLLLCTCTHKYVLAFPFLPIILSPGFHEFCWHTLCLPQVSPTLVPLQQTPALAECADTRAGWHFWNQSPFLGARKLCSLGVILDETWETNSQWSLSSPSSPWTLPTVTLQHSLSLLPFLLWHGSGSH